MVMSMRSFKLSVSHSQVVIFDPSLPRPFNFWTKRHSNQGFAWRPGSVAFRTVAGGGPHLVTVSVMAAAVDVPADAVRVIQVPFEVPPSGKIEVASVPDSKALQIQPGLYQLRFECLNGKSVPEINLIFTKEDTPTFAILRSDSELSTVGELLLDAEPA